MNGKGVKPVAALAGKGSTQGYEPAFEWGPGWAALLTRDYQAAHRADVINRGFGGYNSRWMRQAHIHRGSGRDQDLEVGVAWGWRVTGCLRGIG